MVVSGEIKGSEEAELRGLSVIRKLGWLDRAMWVLQITGAEQGLRSDGGPGCWLCCLAYSGTQDTAWLF